MVDQVRGSAIVWDREGDPPHAIGEVWCWKSYAQGNLVHSIPRYIEDNAVRIRGRYLAFIHELGESKVNGRRLVEHLDAGDGFSFWWMGLLAEKSPLKSPRIYDCLRLLALEEILRERMPDGLTLNSSDRALIHAVRRLCDNLHIRFTRQSGKPTQRAWSLRRCFEAMPHPVQGLIGLGRHLVRRWPLRKPKAPPWFSGDQAVFLCSYFIHLDQASCAQGRFHSRQWEMLPNSLHDHGKRTNWIQHFLFSSTVPNVSTGLGWIRLFNRDAERQGHHAFLDAYLGWRVAFRALRRWIWLNAVGWRLRSIPSAFCPRGSGAWLWPCLRDDLLTSVTGKVAMSNCLWVELFDAALADIPHQMTGLYLCENQGWERALLRAWRRHGHGEIIGVQHTTVPFWHLYYAEDPRTLKSSQTCPVPLPDRMAVNGPVAWRSFAEAGYPIERLVEVEALRYLNLLRMKATPNLDSTNVDILKHQVSTSRRNRVLILGDLLPTSMHSILCLLQGAVKLLPSTFSFTLKPHPGYAVNLADYPGLQVTKTTDALDDILDQYEIALATNSTSAAIDAYFSGLPLIIGLDGGGLNLSPLRSQTGVRFVSTPEELAEALLEAGDGVAKNSDPNDFFFLDAELPRWNRLLSNAIPT